MPQDLRLFHSGVGSMKDLFNKKADQHRQSQLENPFSEWEGAGRVRRLSKEDVGYGKPLPGSESERRSQAAKAHIMMDIRYLCDMIWDCSEYRNSDGRAAISFGKLFKLYLSISDKVVGTLLRARKHGFVHFDGEMLYQRRDDDKIIELTRPINTIRARFGQKAVAGGGEVEEWGAVEADSPPVVRRNSTPGGTTTRRLSLVGDDLKPLGVQRGRRFSAPHATRSLTASPERLLARCAAMGLADDTDLQNNDTDTDTDTPNNNKDTDSQNNNKGTDTETTDNDTETQTLDKHTNQTINTAITDHKTRDNDTDTQTKDTDHTGENVQSDQRVLTQAPTGRGEPPDQPTSQESQDRNQGDPTISINPPVFSISCEDDGVGTAGEVDRVRDVIHRSQRYLLEPTDHEHGRHRRSRSSTPTPMDTIPEDTPTNQLTK